MQLVAGSSQREVNTQFSVVSATKVAQAIEARPKIQALRLINDQQKLPAASLTRWREISVHCG
jgi:hypothetical protein